MVAENMQPSIALNLYNTFSNDPWSLPVSSGLIRPIEFILNDSITSIELRGEDFQYKNDYCLCHRYSFPSLFYKSSKIPFVTSMQQTSIMM